MNILCIYIYTLKIIYVVSMYTFAGDDLMKVYEYEVCFHVEL